jgi:hypothetical protein
MAGTDTTDYNSVVSIEQLDFRLGNQVAEMSNRWAQNGHIGQALVG